MPDNDTIDKLNKCLDQAAELIERLRAPEFVEMAAEDRMTYAETLADAIEQAKVAAEFLSRRT